MNTLTEYHSFIDENGLEKTWDYILSEIFPNDFFSPDRLGGLYEDGLAYENKIEKKAMGKYYTPIDVAKVMADFLLPLPGENICDLCCGTGNLILAVLDEMGIERAQQALEAGNIYLYDIDKTAMNICKAILINKYGSCAENIHLICQDCLCESLRFPENAKIISNPPYGKMESLKNNIFPCAKTTKELYVAFMEKVIQEKVPCVIIIPHSFLGGSTFKVLRNELLQCGGAIYAFDNVPANIFKGKKFGIFNSNEANSTRAAITIIDPKKQGYQVAPFIRFRSSEREAVLNTKFLTSLLPENIQNKKNDIFYRVERGTETLVEQWFGSSKTLGDLLVSSPTEYKMDVPNTCRYFTTGAAKTLSRSGKLTIYFKDEDSFYLGYAFINSSLCYYWHRMCNGGITYPISLLKAMPIFGVSDEALKAFCNKMIDEEEEYIVLKKNAGVLQENIKFPMEYHNILNSLLLEQLNLSSEGLLKIHSNSCLQKENFELDEE